ncbi:YgaP family membrane protein [Salibacterium sp. K-3]
MEHNQQNIGVVQALLRITFGLTLISWANARASRMRWSPENHMLCTIFGAMKAAEGITRFCPMVKLYEMTTTRQRAAENTPEHHNMHEA